MKSELLSGSALDRIGITLVVLAILGILVYQHFTVYERCDDMGGKAAACRYLRDNRTALLADSKFHNIWLGLCGQWWDCIEASGWVKQQSDLDDLRAEIEQSRPPVRVNYYVTVRIN